MNIVSIRRGSLVAAMLAVVFGLGLVPTLGRLNAQPDPDPNLPEPGTDAPAGPPEKSWESPDKTRMNAQREWVRGTTRLAVELYKRLGATPGNLVYSPHSLAELLGMLVAGAEGDTAREIMKAAQFSLPSELLHTALQDVRYPWMDRDDRFVWIANGVWSPVGETIRPDYVKLLEHCYGGQFHSVDFAKHTEEARADINAWIEKNTHEMIKDFLKAQDLSPMTVLMAVNALYFKAQWEAPFDLNLTRDADFHPTPESTLSCKMMGTNGAGEFGYSRGIGYTRVDLEYGHDSACVLTLLVPDAGTLAEFERRITADALLEMLPASNRTSLVLQMPRFKIETSSDLKPVMEALGMKAAFDREKANFGRMLEAPTGKYIGLLKQLAMIDVDEQGTTGAAASAGGLTFEGEPEEPKVVVIDRPFVFVLHNTYTREILFMGRLVTP